MNNYFCEMTETILACSGVWTMRLRSICYLTLLECRKIQMGYCCVKLAVCCVSGGTDVYGGLGYHS